MIGVRPCMVAVMLVIPAVPVHAADFSDQRVFTRQDDREKLDEIRAAAPESVAFAGVDGDAVADFRSEFEVDAAPATLTFADGDFVEAIEGRRSPEQLAEMFENAFDHSPALE